MLIMISFSSIFQCEQRCRENDFTSLFNRWCWTMFDQTTNQGISTLNSKTLPNLYENLPGLFQIIMN